MRGVRGADVGGGCGKRGWCHWSAGHDGRKPAPDDPSARLTAAAAPVRDILQHHLLFYAVAILPLHTTLRITRNGMMNTKDARPRRDERVARLRLARSSVALATGSLRKKIDASRNTKMP